MGGTSDLAPDRTGRRRAGRVAPGLADRPDPDERVAQRRCVRGWFRPMRNSLRLTRTSSNVLRWATRARATRIRRRGPMRTTPARSITCGACSAPTIAGGTSRRGSGDALRAAGLGAAELGLRSRPSRPSGRAARPDRPGPGRRSAGVAARPARRRPRRPARSASGSWASARSPARSAARSAPTRAWPTCGSRARSAGSRSRRPGTPTSRSRTSATSSSASGSATTGCARRSRRRPGCGSWPTAGSTCSSRRARSSSTSSRSSRPGSAT